MSSVQFGVSQRLLVASHCKTHPSVASVPRLSPLPPQLFFVVGRIYLFVGGFFVYLFHLSLLEEKNVTSIGLALQLLLLFYLALCCVGLALLSRNKCLNKSVYVHALN